MKKLIIVAALAAVAGFTGCKSIEVERKGQTIAAYTDTNGVVRAVCDASGKPVLLDGGWTVDYFQHWNWQRFDTLNATAGAGVMLQLNGYQSGADSNLIALVKTSFDGATYLAAKIGAAIASCGGSCAADGLGGMIGTAVQNFLTKGGDVKNATITCKDGNCTISDGRVSESCVGCYDCAPAK